ncbi:MAG TPA: hypothetical protein VFD58_06715 [Blastocatellia bacterium]|nr:hypothetical protein [Blastocatellia bacterium]
MSQTTKSALLLGGTITAAVVATLAAAAAEIYIVVKASEKMIEVAGKIGSKSKDDFDEFARAVRSANFEVTKTDRAISQDLLKSVQQVRGATDGLFVELVRTNGPALSESDTPGEAGGLIGSAVSKTAN